MAGIFHSRQFLFSLILLLFWLLPVHGSQGEPATPDNLGFTSWLEAFEKEALTAGVSQTTLDKALTGITYNSRVIELDRNQPEFKQTLSQYLSGRVTASRVSKGKHELAAHRDLLKKVEKRYGVEPHYLVALWGMESYYCSYTGNFPILEALATLSFDPRRSLFFKRELLAALQLLDRGTISLGDLKGSWAGALGCLQFLPSIFKEYGIDFEEDGRLEIFQAGGDLFASAAYYLKDSGWQSGGDWGAEVTVAVNREGILPADRRPRPISFWLNHGVSFKDAGKGPGKNLKAALIQPDKQENRYFLIFVNFEVLLKWNRSDYYAIAVGLLADRIGRAK